MNPDQHAALRRMVRRYLAERVKAAQTAETIHYFISMQMPCLVSDVEDALLFLERLEKPQVKAGHDPMGGAAKYWQITGEGILAHERG